MTGSVFYLEMLLGSRRGKQYIFRWIYAGWLLLQFIFFYLLSLLQAGGGLAAPFDDSFLRMFVVQQLFLILLATPAFVAGAVTDEKTRGTLQYLLTADLTPGEIVLGKLLGRLAQVAMLVLSGLPVLCFSGIFGGLDLLMLTSAMAVSFLAMFAIGAASILASVWNRQTRDAVLSLYAIGGLGYFAWWGIRAWAESSGKPAGTLLGRIDGLLKHFDPIYVLEPAWGDHNLKGLLGRLFVAALLWGSIGGVCLVLAVCRLRMSYVRQLENEGRKKKKLRWWQARRSEVSDDPVRWKERQIEGLAPLSVLRRIPTWVGVIAVYILTVFSSVCILWSSLSSQDVLQTALHRIARADLTGLVYLWEHMGSASDAFRAQAMLVMLLASLVVGIRCSGAVSGERERQTWEALLLTPLETRQLIRGKLWGIIGASYPFLAAYAIPAMFLALVGGPAAWIWTVLWLPVTWLAMYYVGAAGIWCSVRSKSSWRSLLGTLGFCYVGGFIIYGPLFIILFIVAGIFLLFLSILDNILGLNLIRSAPGPWFLKSYFFAMCLGLAGLFWLLAWFFIRDAEKRVSELERTRHWKYDPNVRFRQRRR